jgi:glycyl-tRNA synthetase beta subunit
LHKVIIFKYISNTLVKDKQDYLVIIDALLELKPAVDDFFNNVRVLDDDVELRKDRLK